MSGHDEDLIDCGVGYLRLVNAVKRADQILTKLSSDKGLDLLLRSDIRSASLILREATE